jgi:ADP-ribose pyrophosphatase YjhB (NUDIX family)
MSDPRHSQSEEIRIRVALAVVQGDRILLLPHYHTDAGPVQWCIPGGRLRFGESLRQAAEREFEEETGLRAQVGALLDVSEVVLQDEPYHSITIAFSGTVLGGEERPEPDHRYGEKMPRWVHAHELRALVCHPEQTVEKALGLESSVRE